MHVLGMTFIILNVQKKRDFKACEVRETAVYYGVNEDFEDEYNVAFKRGQRVACTLCRAKQRKGT